MRLPFVRFLQRLFEGLKLGHHIFIGRDKMTGSLAQQLAKPATVAMSMGFQRPNWHAESLSDVLVALPRNVLVEIATQRRENGATSFIHSFGLKRFHRAVEDVVRELLLEKPIRRKRGIGRLGSVSSLGSHAVELNSGGAAATLRGVEAAEVIANEVSKTRKNECAKSPSCAIGLAQCVVLAGVYEERLRQLLGVLVRKALAAKKGENRIPIEFEQLCESRSNERMLGVTREVDPGPTGDRK